MSQNEILKNETSHPTAANATDTTDAPITTNQGSNNDIEDSKDNNDSSPFDFDDFTNNSDDFINYSNIRSGSNKNSIILNKSKDNDHSRSLVKDEAIKPAFDQSDMNFEISSISSSSVDKLLLKNKDNEAKSEYSTSSMIDLASASATSAASSIKSISTSSPRYSNKRYLNNIKKAKSPGNIKSDAIKRAIAKKNSLQAQFNAISVQRRQLTERENDLQNKIDNLNDQSGETMRILDSKKDFLLNENDELRMQYERYPTVEYLSKQLAILTEILETIDDNEFDNISEYNDDNSDSDVSSETESKSDVKKSQNNEPKNNFKRKKKRVLDEDTMRKIGVLQKSNEDLSILPERLSYLVNRLDTMKAAIISLTPKSNSQLSLSSNSETSNDPEQQKKILQEEKEKNELMRKIKLLKITMNASFNRTQFQCENLQIDIQRLVNECETLKTITNNLPKLRRNRSGNSSRFTTPSKSSIADSGSNSVSNKSDNTESAEEFFFNINETQTKLLSNSSPNSPNKESLLNSPSQPINDKGSNSSFHNEKNSKPNSNTNSNMNSNSNNDSDSADLTEEDLKKYKEGYALSALSFLDIFDKDVKHMLKDAGGDVSNLHFNGNNEYEYNGFRFKVSKKDDKLYAFSDGDTVLLPMFLSNIVYL